MRAVANGKKFTWIAQDSHAYRNVTDADPVIDQCAALPRGVPPIDVAGADLELERGRHSVPRLVAVRLRGLLVGVKVDEPR